MCNEGAMSVVFFQYILIPRVLDDYSQFLRKLKLLCVKQLTFKGMADLSTFLLSVKIAYRIPLPTEYIYRVPCFLSKSRPNWLPMSPPHPQASVAPRPLVPGGGTHSLSGGGQGEPVRMKGQTLWYSRYSIIHPILRPITLVITIAEKGLWAKSVLL
jgi:hypothetical protein